jgi:nucleotidyltransferase substrate binding protein (TIGR01987 family)
MKKVALKHQALLAAITRLHEAIIYFNKIKSSELNPPANCYYAEAYAAARDSLIKRFEFSIELLWKYLKCYLESVKNVTISSNTPRDIIRDASRATLISEQEAATLLELLTQRNHSAHIYKEEMAEEIAHKIIQTWNTFDSITKRLQA